MASEHSVVEIKEIVYDRRFTTEDLNMLELVTKGCCQDHKDKKIRRVPEMLRNFEEYFEPQIISIGPIHYNNPRIDQSTNSEFKIRLMRKFFESSQVSIFRTFKLIKDNINELKNSFDEDVTKTYEDDTLVRMLFLDGCAILQFIDSFVHKELIWLEVTRGQVEIIIQDLFLLENQIPFQVLMLLLQSSNRKDIFLTSIRDFMDRNAL
ncbi:hypothetical protein TorRG33x02_124630, partial [Trema orientale]